MQSGSDRILARMNRRYDRHTYLERVARLRAVCPQIAITSDIIVGFPGETDDDFHRTMDLIETVGYDGLFAFHYSDRPVAPASRFSEKVPERVKRERLQTLLTCQHSITLARNRQLVGSLQPVLVEGHSKRSGRVADDGRTSADQWTGRTAGNKIVNFSEPQDDGRPPLAVGSLCRVRIEEAFAHSLRGVRQPSVPARSCDSKGGTCHAA